MKGLTAERYFLNVSEASGQVYLYILWSRLDFSLRPRAALARWRNFRYDTCREGTGFE